MNRLVELGDADQAGREPGRRWFSSDEMDLIAWYTGGTVNRFELCYDKSTSEHVLIWDAGSGFEHLAVDDGERVSGLDYKETPIYVQDGHVDIEHIRNRFADSCSALPGDLYHIIGKKLLEFPCEDARE